MASEQSIQSKIIKLLKSKGAYVVKVQSGTRSGIPDLIACYKGLFLGLEVKKPKTKEEASKLQELNIKWIKDAGGIATVVWTTDMVNKILKDCDEALRTSN